MMQADLIFSTFYSSEAACLAELSSSDESFDEQEALSNIMLEVPKNMKRIAGKSLPVEVNHADIRCKRADPLI
jgi:hypothetical protein